MAQDPQSPAGSLSPDTAGVPDPAADGAAQLPGAEPEPPGRQPAGKSLTIGAVCKALQQEFPDISISKIRYLEDQKLLSPRRTAGGYRLYSTSAWL